MRFRPCIDIHNNQVKQIVGGSLRDDGKGLRTNFESEYDSAYYAKMYQRDNLPGGHVIKKGKLRGVESQGMLCSGPEIGVPVELYPSVGDAGLLVFNEEYPLGTDVRTIFGLDDTVIDFEILANRPTRTGSRAGWPEFQSRSPYHPGRKWRARRCPGGILH